MNKYTKFLITSAMCNLLTMPFVSNLQRTYTEPVRLMATMGNLKYVPSVQNPSMTSSLERPLIDSHIDTPESETVEYKQTFTSASYEKLGQTIVAISNSGGGKLVWGIRDDLFIVGIENDYSLWDKHCLRIVEVLKRQVAPNVPGTKFIEQRLSGKRNIYHMTIAPSQEMLSFNGVEVTRMSASNCLSKECKWVKLSEYNSLKQQFIGLNEEINDVVNMLKHIISKTNKK
jgi:hypothetical protein